MKKKAIVIGSGIGGLGAANLLAQKNYEVLVLEKNDYLGGRIGLVEAEGFKFDKGPSWYLMPDVFEHYFELFGKKVSDYLNLVPLKTSYRIFFEGTGEHVDLSAEPEKVAELFESWEKGAGEKFIKYLAKAKEAYDLARDVYIYKNYDSVLDLFDKRALKTRLSPRMLFSMDKYVGSWFKDERIRKILQYQLVFLGGSPYNTPALYSIMNHIDFNMGVFYPQGGIYEIVKALTRLGEELGVTYRTSAPVSKILVKEGKVCGVKLQNGEEVLADLVVSNADLQFTDAVLLDEEYRERSSRYWNKRTLAPSAYIMYLGMKDEVAEFSHHNLLFARDWNANFGDIFDSPKWPEKPSVYVCAPGKTDPSVSPEGKENLFVLAPIASGLEYDHEFLKNYGDRLLDWMGMEMKVKNFRDRVQFRQDYSVNDFARDYNSFKGTALGLAHTLGQSVIFRPNNVAKKVKNLYYVGAGTTPGIGMPICLISAELMARRIKRI